MPQSLASTPYSFGQSKLLDNQFRVSETGFKGPSVHFSAQHTILDLAFLFLLVSFPRLSLPDPLCLDVVLLNEEILLPIE